MLSYLGQAIVHAIVAAAVVEALLRVWRIQQADTRLSCRLLALLLPVAALPLFSALATVRATPAFTERWAILSTSRWGQVRLGSVGLDVAALGALGALGVLLYLLDFLPALRTSVIDRRLPVANDSATQVQLASRVASLAASLRVRAPSVRLVESRAPILLCSGFVRQRLVVSTRTVSLLDARQLEAALAHELAHARHRDPLLSWVLMAARTLFFFSPATQFVARSAVDDLERRADDLSVSVVDDRLGMAGALVRLFAAQHPAAVPVNRRRSGVQRLASAFHLGRMAAVERRCRRLLSAQPARPAPFGPCYVAVTALSLMVLLFFVV